MTVMNCFIVSLFPSLSNSFRLLLLFNSSAIRPLKLSKSVPYFARPKISGIDLQFLGNAILEYCEKLRNLLEFFKFFIL